MEYIRFLDNNPELIKNQDELLKIILDIDKINVWQDREHNLLLSRNQPTSWADIGVILNDPYFLVVRDLVEFPDGQMHGYSRVIGQANLKGGHGVVVLPEYQGKIMLLHQFRHPTRKWHYEVPRGYGEPNVSAEENARKEIEEEIGGKIELLVNLGEFYNNSGLESYAVSLFYAQLSSVGKPNENEGIESYIWLTLEQLEEWIADGKITDGFTLAAYVKAKLRNLL